VKRNPPLVDANIIGVVIGNLEGAIIEANDAFLDMVGYSRDDLVAGRLQRTALTPAEWRAATERAIAELRTTGVLTPTKKNTSGKTAAECRCWSARRALEDTRTQWVSFVLDLTERKRAEEALQRPTRSLRTSPA